MFQQFNHRLGHYLLLGLAWAALCLPNLGAPSLWDVDEGHNAEAAREMLVAGNLVVPTFNYHWRHDKPALLYWLQMAAYELFGINEWSARLPSALAALAVILITYELGRRMFSTESGLLAGLIVASTVMFAAAAHFANPDALLLAFTSLSLLFFWHSYANETRSWFVLAGLSTGFAVLGKGPVGLVLPSGVVIAFLLWTRRLNLLWDWRLLVGSLVGVLVAAPWYAAVVAETKGVFFQEFFLKHNAGRFGATMEGHGGPIVYYLVCLIVGFAPWSVFFGPTIFYATGRRARADVNGSQTSRGMPEAYRFLWCWIAVYLAFFSLSATKLPNYVLPVYPPLAILTGQFLSRWQCGGIRAPSWVMNTCLICLGLVGVGVAAGLIAVSGVHETSLLSGRSLPGLEIWAFLGLVPIFGACFGWWCTRRELKNGLIAGVLASAVLFVALLAAGAAVAVDKHKAARTLMSMLPAQINEREVRIACYDFYQPSVVFYCRREVTRLETPAAAVDLLKSPFEVYMLVSAPAWDSIQSQITPPCHILGSHTDLYSGKAVILVTNAAPT